MTTKYDFDQAINRRGSGSIKWEKYGDRDILPMWVADTDFAVAPAIQQALSERVAHPVYGYTQPGQRLLDMLVERMWRLYRWQIDASWIVMLPNVITAFYLACRARGRPGEAVLQPGVIYPPFALSPTYYGMTTQPIPMRAERMVMDLDWLEQNPGNPGQLIFLCNPQNPGGAVYRRDELERFADIVERQQLNLVSDELR